MLFQEFIDLNMLTFKLKECEQTDFPSDQHVKTKVVVKSPLLDKKFKAEFTYNPSCYTFSLGDFLRCVQSDCSCAYDCFNDFRSEFGDEEKSYDIWRACVKQKKNAEKYFGPLFDSLMECEEE